MRDPVSFPPGERTLRLYFHFSSVLKNLYTFQSSIYNSRDTRNVGHTRVRARILFSLSPPLSHISHIFLFHSVSPDQIVKFSSCNTLLYSMTNLTLFLFCLILIRERSRIYNYLHYIRVTSHTWKRYVCIYMYFYFISLSFHPFSFHIAYFPVTSFAPQYKSDTHRLDAIAKNVIVKFIRGDTYDRGIHR